MKELFALIQIKRLW